MVRCVRYQDRVRANSYLHIDPRHISGNIREPTIYITLRIVQTLRHPKQLPTPQPSAHNRHHLSTKLPAHTRKQKHRVPEKEPLGQKLRTETPAVELQQLGKH
ncbi:hypothetical protein [Moorena producens]|uniref:hypothetical protein n=1 Tax=Moorena producens TaxID=1155739 RepID=UPI0011EA71AC|nr:hypothetical protein [Moorena producens]